MIKDDFFEWIRRFGKEDYTQLKRYSNVLFSKPQQYVKRSSKVIQEWKAEDEKVLFKEVANKLKKEAKKKFGDSKQTIGRLKDFIHSFIIKNYIKNNKHLKYQLLFKATKNFDYQDAYFHFLDKRKEFNEKQDARSFDYWEEEFDINYQRYFAVDFEKHLFVTNKNRQEFEPRQILHESWQSLQLGYWIKQYRMALEIEYVRESTSTSENNEQAIDLTYLEKVLPILNLPQSNILDIYRNLYQWLIAENWKNLEGLIDIINESIEQIKLFSNSEKSALLIMLINCLSRTLGNAKDMNNVIKQIVRVGMFGFNNNIFEKVDENVFLSIYDCAYRTEPKFCEEMSTKYIDCLPSTIDKEWCMAFIKIRELSKEKKYPEILIILENLKHHNNFRLAIRRYSMQIQYFYELSYAIKDKSNSYNDDVMEMVLPHKFKSLKATIRHSLTNATYLQKPSKAVIGMLKKFIVAVSMLYYETYTLSDIEKYIDKHPLFAKLWLNEKITALKTLRKKA